MDIPRRSSTSALINLLGRAGAGGNRGCTWHPCPMISEVNFAAAKLRLEGNTPRRLAKSWANAGGKGIAQGPISRKRFPAWGDKLFFHRIILRRFTKLPGRKEWCASPTRCRLD